MATDTSDGSEPLDGREGPGAPFADEPTRVVLGVDAFEARLSPLSEPGRRRSSHPPTFGPADESAWRREMDHLRATEGWWHDHPDERRAAEAALAELPSIHKLLRLLQRPAPERGILSDVQLFRLKRFCFFGARLFDGAAGLCGAQDAPPGWEDRLRATIATLHPGGADHPRFHLADALDERLEELRETRRDVRRQLRRRRETLEEAVVDDLGGSFDLQGTYRAPETPEKPEPLEDDPRLEYRAGRWQLADDRLETLAARADTLDEELDDLEREVRGDLTATLADRAEWLARVADTLAAADVRLAKIRLKSQIDGCWAQWLSDDAHDDERDGQSPDAPPSTVLQIDGARHPELLRQTETSGESIQPIDVELRTAGPTVVTGPNMGGKSALLRVIGLAQWCAQHAMPVPADRYRARPHRAVVYVGSEEPHAADAAEGLSSFAREVRRIVEWRDRSHNPDGHPTLWLLDEVGRGTHPQDGAALAARLLTDLHGRGHTVVAATHFPDVAALEGADNLLIPGLSDDDALEARLGAGPHTLEAVESALRRMMDYQPVRPAATPPPVPRDARRVARALGLDFEN